MFIECANFFVALQFMSHYSPGSVLKCDSVDLGGFRTMVHVALHYGNHTNLMTNSIFIERQYDNVKSSIIKLSTVIKQ